MLAPAARLLHHLGVTANQVSVTSILFSLLAGALLCWRTADPHGLLLLPVALMLRMAMNAIDGILAKEFEIKSRFGIVLNELGDVFSEAALYLPLALGWHFSAVLIVVFVVLAVISEMSGMAGLLIGAGRRYDGPLGYAERAFALGLIALLIGLGVPAGLWQNLLLGLMLTLLAYTIYNRAHMALWRGQ